MSQDVVEVQAPVFLPISSIILAASGIDECWNPADGMRDQISTFRGFCGVAGGLSGRRPSVAIIRLTSFGHASVGLPLRPPHGSFSPPPPRPAGAGAGACACGACGAAPACCARAGANVTPSNAAAESTPPNLRI